MEFLNLLKWRNFKLQSVSRPTYKHVCERKYHWIDALCLQIGFEMSKNNKKKVAKKTFISRPPPKMTLNES